MEPLFSVVLPCINELPSLKTLVPKLLGYNCEVIVCDNGSTDGSVEYVRSLSKVVLSTGKGSVVDAILRGISRASCEKVVIVDSDGSHPVDLVWRLAGGLNYYDITVGSRYIEDGRNLDTSKNRLISRAFNLLTLGLTTKIRDRASGAWGVKKSLVQTTPIRDTTKPMLETLVRSRVSKVVEIPYTFEPRKFGSSKLSRSFKTIVREFWSILLLYVYKFRKPIKFLIVGGVGVGINLGLLAFFTEVAGLWYILSSAIGILMATTWNYLLNNYWTFGSRRLL